MTRNSPARRIATFAVVVSLAVSTVSPVLGAPQTRPGGPPTQVENIGAAFEVPFLGHSLQARLDNSNVAKATVRRYGRELDRDTGAVEHWNDGSELAIIPYASPRTPSRANGAAWLVFGILPSGEDFAINLELDKTTQELRYTDATGAGVRVQLEVKGDKFRFKTSSPIDRDMGFRDKLYEAMGIGTARAFSWLCWAKCVPKFCPAGSYCWWSCGWACGGCLALCVGTFGWGCTIGCVSCVGCLGHIAYVCASRC